LTKGIYDRTLIKYKEGMVSSFELNQSKQQQLQAEGQRIQSIINVLNKKIALDKAYSNL
jgi:outer membrane protein TolC